MKVMRNCSILLIFTLLSTAWAFSHGPEHPLLKEFQKARERNEKFIKEGKYDSTSFIISHPLIKKGLSQAAYEEAEKLLREFNKKYGLSLYFHLALTVADENNTVQVSIPIALPAPTQIVQAANIEAVVQLEFQHIISSTDTANIQKSVRLKFGSKNCDTILGERLRNRSLTSISFETNPDKALIAYANTSIQAMEDCMDRNDSSNPALQHFMYQMTIGASNSLSSFETTAQNKLSVTVDPAASNLSIFDYAGVLNEEQEKIIQDVITSEIGGANIPLKYYITDGETDQTIFEKIKSLSSPGKGILIWNHYDKSTNEVYTSIKIGDEIEALLQQAKISSGNLVDRIWKSFKEVVSEPDKVFSGDNALIKTVLLANPLVRSLTASYWTAKFAINILEYLEIPREAYDPLHAGYYPIMNLLVPFDKKEQFAFLCGLINGLNAEIKGIGELMEMLIGYFVDDQKKAEIDAMFAKLKEVNLIDVWKQNLQNAYNLDNGPCFVAHQVGKDVLAVATLFVGVGTATKVGKASLILKFTNPLQDLYSGLARLGKFIIKKPGDILEIVCARIKVVIKKSTVKDAEITTITYALNGAGDTPLQNPEKYLPDEYAPYGMDWGRYYIESKFPVGDGNFYPITETFDFAEGFEGIQGKFFKVADGSADGRLEFIGKEHIDELSTSVGIIAIATKAITKTRLPSSFMSALKKFGKSEDDILEYFTKYHNERSGQKFLNEIEEFMANTNVNNLTRDEAFALWGYTTKYFYKDLNAWLRSGVNIIKTSDISNLLNSALTKLPNYNGTKVFRGLEIDPSQLDNFISSYSNGSSKVFNDFQSCGGSIQASFGGRPSVNVIFEIDQLTAKEISNLADGIKYGVPPMPKPEILIKSGSQFKVVAPPIFDSQMQKWVIRLQQTQ